MIALTGWWLLPPPTLTLGWCLVAFCWLILFVLFKYYDYPAQNRTLLRAVFNWLYLEITWKQECDLLILTVICCYPLLLFFNFFLILEYNQLAMLRWFLVDSKRTQPYLYMYPFSPKLPSHPGCHTILSRVHVQYSRSLLVIHFKYSTVFLLILNSLTIESNGDST